MAELVIRSDGPRVNVPGPPGGEGNAKPETLATRARLEEIRALTLAGKGGWYPVVSALRSEGEKGEPSPLRHIGHRVKRSHRAKDGWHRRTVTERDKEGREWRTLYMKYEPSTEVAQLGGARAVEGPGPTDENGAAAIPPAASAAAPVPRPHPDALKGAPALAGMDWVGDAVDDGAGRPGSVPGQTAGGWGSA